MQPGTDDTTWIRFYKEGTLSGTLTFQEAAELIPKKAAEYSAFGLRAGDRVIVKMRNSIQTVLTHLALLHAEIIGIPVHPKEEESRLHFISEDSGAKGVFTEEGYTPLPGSGATDKESEGTRTIMYTSGTTGVPKGVCLSWNNLRTDAEMLIAHHGFGPDVAIAAPLPIFHCNGYVVSMLSTYFSKTTLILFDDVPENFLDIAESEKATIISVVPAILHRLYAEHPDWKAYPELSHIMTGAAPLSPQLLSNVLDRWGTRVLQGYGMTESACFSTFVPRDLSDAEYRAAMFPAPSIGVAFPGVEIRIGDTDEEGALGELSIRAVTNSAGYWRKPKNESEWLSTGDLASYKVFAGRKFYYHKGRLKEIINRGGEKISPAELENEIVSLGASGTFAVVGIPDEELGEEVALAYVESFDESILESIPRYRRPKKIFKVEKIPVTSTGKIRRAMLREQYLSTNLTDAKA